MDDYKCLNAKNLMRYVAGYDEPIYYLSII